LLAYGKSMFNLGWRYEHALGARRNLSEAARCYWKAARLGDPEAAGRLAQEPLTPPDHPAPSPAS
jgi:TPR repeat protein